MGELTMKSKKKSLKFSSLSNPLTIFISFPISLKSFKHWRPYGLVLWVQLHGRKLMIISDPLSKWGLILVLVSLPHQEILVPSPKSHWRFSYGGTPPFWCDDKAAIVPRPPQSVLWQSKIVDLVKWLCFFLESSFDKFQVLTLNSSILTLEEFILDCFYMHVNTLLLDVTFRLDRWHLEHYNQP